MAFGYMGIIFYLSSRSYPQSLIVFEGMDLVLHFIEYGILGFLLYEMFKNEKNAWMKRYARALSFFCASVYGMTDEVHQHFVPTRCMSLMDWVMDTLGSLTLVAVWIRVKRCFSREGAALR